MLAVTHPRLAQVQVTGGAAGDTPESFLHQFAGAGSFGFAFAAPDAPSYVPPQVGQVPPCVPAIQKPLETKACARHTTIRCARGEGPSLVLLTSLVLFNTRGDGRNYRPDM